MNTYLSVQAATGGPGYSTIPHEGHYYYHDSALSEKAETSPLISMDPNVNFPHQ